MSKISRKQLIESLFEDIHVMRHKLTAGAAHAHVITPVQGIALRCVAKKSPANIKTIAKTLHITSSAATQLVDGLVEKGFLVRTENSKDRRSITLSLTPKSKKLFKELKAQSLLKITDLCGALSDTELAEYAALSKKITNSLSKSNR